MATTGEQSVEEHFRERFCPKCGYELVKPDGQPVNEKNRIRVWEHVNTVQSFLDGFSADERKKLFDDPQRDIKLLKLLADAGHGDAQIILAHNGWFLRLLAGMGSNKAYKLLITLQIPYGGVPSLIRTFQEDEKRELIKNLGMPQDGEYYYTISGTSQDHDYTYEEFGVRLYALPDSYPCSLPYIRSDKATKSSRKPQEVILEFPMKYFAYGNEFIMRLRRRIFHLDSPAFVEELWHPKRGYSMTLRGLELLPNNQDRIEMGKILLNGLAISTGRPKHTGYFSDKGSLERALYKAFSAIRKRGRKITQKSVADYFSSNHGFPNCSARQIRRWLSDFDMDWDETLSRF